MYQQQGGFNGGGNFGGGRGGRGGFGGGQGQGQGMQPQGVRYADRWYSQQEIDEDNRNLGLACLFAPFTCGMSLMGYAYYEATRDDRQQPYESDGYTGGYSGGKGRY